MLVKKNILLLYFTDLTNYEDQGWDMKVLHQTFLLSFLAYAPKKEQLLGRSGKPGNQLTVESLKSDYIHTFYVEYRPP